jgi:hypothetical protein
MFVSDFTEYFVDLIFAVEQHMVIQRRKDRNCAYDSKSGNVYGNWKEMNRTRLPLE